MQAVILAAGRGKRISVHSDKHPKSLLKIKKKSIIRNQVEQFLNAGIKDITVVVGYKNESIKKELSRFNIRYVWNPFYEQTNVLGSFWFAIPHLKDDFIFVHADTIFEEEVLNRLFKKKGRVVLPVELKECGEEEMKVKIRRNKIIEINKTMKPSSAQGEFIGLAKISKKMIPKILAYTNKHMDERNFTAFFESVIQDLIKNKVDVIPVDITGLKWNEIDFPEDYKKAIKLFEDK